MTFKTASRRYGSRARLVELSFGTPVLPDEMASHSFRLRQIFRLAGILLATEILLNLSGSAAMAMTLTRLPSNKTVKFPRSTLAKAMISRRRSRGMECLKARKALS